MASMPSPQPVSRPSTGLWARLRVEGVAVYVALCGLLTLWQLAPGADYANYTRWGLVLATGNWQALEGPGASVMGVPFCQWGPGPGQALAPWMLVLPTQWNSAAGLIAGGFAVAGGWWLLYQSFRQLLGAELAKLCLLWGALGSQLGYTSLAISSESLGLLPLGVLLWYVTRHVVPSSDSKINPPEYLTTGAMLFATAMLLMLRSYWGAFAWPALWLYLSAPRTSLQSRFFRAALVGVVVVLSILPSRAVNYWMTGHSRHFAYEFGDGEFQSLNWSSPHAGAALFDYFHGWFPTLPLMALGVISLLGVGILGTLQARKDWESLRIGLAWWWGALAIVANVYIQGCWFYWGLADAGSFGMRGLLFSSLQALLALGLVAHWCLERAPTAGAANRQASSWSQMPGQAVLLAATMCSVYGWLMFSMGPRDFNTLNQLLADLRWELGYWSQPARLAKLGIAACANYACLSAEAVRLRKYWPHVWLLASLLLALLLDRVEAHWPSLALFYGSLLVAGAAWFAVGRLSLRSRGLLVPHGTQVWLRLTCLWGLAMGLVFVPLWWRTQPARLPSNQRAIRFQPMEPLQACAAFAQIPRFRPLALKIARFLAMEEERQRGLADGQTAEASPGEVPTASEAAGRAFLDRLDPASVVRLRIGQPQGTHASRKERSPRAHD